jgi:NADH:ubiquinone reductase (H+-translocating)
MDIPPHLVIVGAGFGGLETARRLARAPLRITLIDRRNYHLFQPLLYQVATAGLSPEEIAYPVRAIFRRQRNLTFMLAEVTGADLDQRRLHTDQGALDYDYLVLAIGGRPDTFGLDSVKRHGLALKDIEGAVAIRNHLLTMFERASHEPDEAARRALLTFVVVGGGPTGVESAGALAELIRLVLGKDYPDIDLDQTRVLLLEAAGHLMGAFPPPLRRATARTLERKHVEVRLDALVQDYDGKTVGWKDGAAIPARTLIWAAGVRAAELAGTLAVERGSLGRIAVTPTLQLPRHPEVYVLGDAAYVENGGGPLPMLATVAVQQARATAANLCRALQGKPQQPFTYRDPGLLATIGRNAAVARIGGFSFHGFPAWVIWLALHIIRLIGFRNRLLVLINWAWDYFFYDRAVRLITPE